MKLQGVIFDLGWCNHRYRASAFPGVASRLPLKLASALMRSFNESLKGDQPR